MAGSKVPSVDLIIPLAPAALLRCQGFRRSGRNFVRREGDLIQSVYFQTFTGAPATFTVNLTVILPFHHFVLRGADLPKSPSAQNCSRLANLRVSHQDENGRNDWWHINSPIDAPKVAREVADHIAAELPFFDRWSHAEKILDSLEGGSHRDELEGTLGSFGRAILLHHLGRRAEAWSLLEGLSDDVPFRDAVERLRGKMASESQRV